MTIKKSRSAFASALEAAMRESSSTRAQWADILGVSEAALSQWLNDDSMPKAANLRSLWVTLLEDTRVSDRALEQLERVFQMPSAKATPRSTRLGRTIASYLVSPLLESFLEMLGTLEPHLQETVLLAASKSIRASRANGLARPSVSERRAELLEGPVAAEIAAIAASKIQAPIGPPSVPAGVSLQLVESGLQLLGRAVLGLQGKAHSIPEAAESWRDIEERLRGTLEQGPDETSDLSANENLVTGHRESEV